MSLGPRGTVTRNLCSGRAGSNVQPAAEFPHPFPHSWQTHAKAASRAAHCGQSFLRNSPPVVVPAENNYVGQRLERDLGFRALRVAMKVRSNSLAGGGKAQAPGAGEDGPWIGNLYLHLHAAALRKTRQIPLGCGCEADFIKAEGCHGARVCDLVIYSKDLIAAN